MSFDNYNLLNTSETRADAQVDYLTFKKSFSITAVGKISVIQN